MNINTANKHLDLESWRKRKWCFDWLWLAKSVLPDGARTICEVGVGPLDISMLPFFEGKAHCQRLIGVEPYSVMADAAEVIEGVEIIRAAVSDKEGAARLVLNWGSTYVDGVSAPTPVSEKKGFLGFKKRVKSTQNEEGEFEDVRSCVFDTIDDGEIDILNVDCEGSEIHVFKHLKSRPKMIGVELFEDNDDKKFITQWLISNGYTIRISSGGLGETEIWTLK